MDSLLLVLAVDGVRGREAEVRPARVGRMSSCCNSGSVLSAGVGVRGLDIKREPRRSCSGVRGLLGLGLGVEVVVSIHEQWRELKSTRVLTRDVTWASFLLSCRHLQLVVQPRPSWSLERVLVPGLQSFTAVLRCITADFGATGHDLSFTI